MARVIVSLSHLSSPSFYDTGFDNFLIYFAAGHNGPDELI
jgi:hypothetical protein